VTRTTGKAAEGKTVSQHDFQAAPRRLQVAIHPKFAFSRLEKHGFAFKN
jgi:hypothetical protein